MASMQPKLEMGDDTLASNSLYHYNGRTDWIMRKVVQGQDKIHEDIHVTFWESKEAFDKRMNHFNPLARAVASDPRVIPCEFEKCMKPCLTRSCSPCAEATQSKHPWARLAPRQLIAPHRTALDYKCPPSTFSGADLVEYRVKAIYTSIHN